MHAAYRLGELTAWQEEPDSLMAEAVKRLSPFGSFAEVCRFPKRAFLLWDGRVRQSTHYYWPVGFKDRWKASGYRGLVKAMRNGPQGRHSPWQAVITGRATNCSPLRRVCTLRLKSKKERPRRIQRRRVSCSLSR